MFCYARCAILKKMISKMLNGTSAIAITAERLLLEDPDEPAAKRKKQCLEDGNADSDSDDDDVAAGNVDGHLFVIKCNGFAIGSFGGEAATILATALDAGQLSLAGGNRAPSWGEADFDVFLHKGSDEAAACEWKRRLKAVDESFEPDVWAKERVCSSGSCDCC